MLVKFFKYQGTGNDFILIDNRAYGLNIPTDKIQKLCDRRFGVGADGLIYLQEKDTYNFQMVYFNSDGKESSMCGNGGRCLIQFANDIGLIDTRCVFIAIDGEHEGEILKDGNVSLRMKDVDTIENYNSDYVLNTGSPHYVRFTNGVRSIAIVDEAKQIRYGERFSKEGINVNFVEKVSMNEIFVRTYERGVEGETLSCGTGVVASALAFASRSGIIINEVKIETPGGNLLVKFESSANGFRNVFLIGPAKKVFEGELEL